MYVVSEDLSKPMWSKQRAFAIEGGHGCHIKKGSRYSYKCKII